MRKVNTSTTSMGTNDKKAGCSAIHLHIYFRCFLIWIWNESPKNLSAGLDTDESSDNEPLIKVAKMTAKAVKKPVSVPAKKSVDTKKKGNFLSM